MINSSSIFIQTGKTPYKHEYSGQFPCLYHIPRLSTAFSVKLIRLSAKTDNTLHPFTFPLYTITEIPDFCVKVYFCLIVRFFPQSPSYQRHLKTRKNGVHQPFQWTPPSLKNLDFKPFFNTFACEYQKSYGINLKLPPVPLLDFDDFYPGVKIFTPFTPPVRNLPHPICGSTNCDFAAITPLFFCGIRYKMISAERSAAFDNSA